MNGNHVWATGSCLKCGTKFTDLPKAQRRTGSARGMCHSCYHKEWYRSLPSEKKASWHKKSAYAHNLLREEVIRELGSECKCCGIRNKKFLTIDHVQNDGKTHRSIKSKGYSLLLDIKKQGYPEEKYQALCWNCNLAKGIYGECPHQENIRKVNRSIV